MNKLKEYYDGYDFAGSKLYAPQDILQFFRNDLKYKNYWFKSGTPTYLIKLLETNNFNIKDFNSGNMYIPKILTINSSILTKIPVIIDNYFVL